MNRIIHWAVQTEIGRRVEIQVLMNLVTSSLGLPGQKCLGIPSVQSLEMFAALTAKHLASATDDQQRMLHAKALALGGRLRKCLFRRDNRSVAEVIFLLYKNIGITMTGHFPGSVNVPRCYFCGYYSPKICKLVSLMDSGVISGLMGGGTLVFTARMTEGKPACLCELTSPNGRKL